MYIYIYVFVNFLNDLIAVNCIIGNILPRVNLSVSCLYYQACKCDARSLSAMYSGTAKENW